MIGLDLSEAMLAHAAENAAAFVAAGKARFVAGDAAGFTIDTPVGLVVSTFDALNHLPSFDALQGCFRSAAAALRPDGHFIFDLNTRLGLRRWNNISVEDSEGALIVTRGIYDGAGDRAWTKISGFVRLPDGRYERFDETVFNTVFAIADVLAALRAQGFAASHAAVSADLDTALADPEQEGRVFQVAHR